jgi:hypothetical protein
VRHSDGIHPPFYPSQENDENLDVMKDMYGRLVLLTERPKVLAAPPVPSLVSIPMNLDSFIS